MLTAWWQQLQRRRQQSRWRSFAADLALAQRVAPALSGQSPDQLRQRLQQEPAAPQGEQLAVVAEMAARTLGQRPYPEQLQAALALLAQCLVDMPTGEGKTLALALAAALLAQRRTGVHVVTANAYLAQRDAQQLQPFYAGLGLQVAWIDPTAAASARRTAYAADVTYVTGPELGFDYLRDQLALQRADQVLRGRDQVLVDEADFVLVDEARQPLVLSAPLPVDDRLVHLAERTVTALQAGRDYAVDARAGVAQLTETGAAAVEAALVTAGLAATPAALYTVDHAAVWQAVHAAVVAHGWTRRDRDYVVQQGALVLVDPATGRLQPGRRWSDGLHQATEAKEGLAVTAEARPLAGTTYQDLFAGYRHLAGLAGTVWAAAEELQAVYGRRVLRLPRRQPLRRTDAADLLFRTRAAKLAAISAEVARRHRQQQPILLGTGSVAASEELSRVLTAAGLPHRVLNARQDAEEAAIIAQAGVPGAITVATSMAGRGVDIVLGGPAPTAATAVDQHDRWRQQLAVATAAGGLCVLGTERQTTRRADDQLRGRAGRQGDPGYSQFFLALDDDLLLAFGDSALAQWWAQRGGTSLPLTGRLVARWVGQAQAQAERRDSAVRQNLLRFDGVSAAQRRTYYRLRQDLLEQQVPAEWGERMLDNSLHRVLTSLAPEDRLPEQWAVKELRQVLQQQFGVAVPVIRMALADDCDPAHFRAEVRRQVLAHWQGQRGAVDTLTLREVQQALPVLDGLWSLHLSALDQLREGIELRAHAQQQPLFAFSQEAHRLFARWVDASADALAQAWLGTDPRPSAAVLAANRVAAVLELRPIRRTEPCPCGSGRRYKFCHGR